MCRPSCAWSPTSTHAQAAQARTIVRCIKSADVPAGRCRLQPHGPATSRMADGWHRPRSVLAHERALGDAAQPDRCCDFPVDVRAYGPRRSTRQAEQVRAWTMNPLIGRASSIPTDVRLRLACVRYGATDRVFFLDDHRLPEPEPSGLAAGEAVSWRCGRIRPDRR